MAADSRTEDYPHEIDEQLTAFDSSLSSIKEMLEKLMSMPRNDLLQKVGWREDTWLVRHCKFSRENKQTQSFVLCLFGMV